MNQSVENERIERIERIAAILGLKQGDEGSWDWKKLEREFLSLASFAHVKAAPPKPPVLYQDLISVKQDHIRHIIEKAELPEEQKEEMLQKVNSLETRERGEAIAQLSNQDPAFQQVREKLAREYSDNATRRAMHMWYLHWTRDLKAEALLELLKQHGDPDAVLGVEKVLEPGDSPEWVRSYRLTPHLLEVEVGLDKFENHTYRTLQVSIPKTALVKIEVDLTEFPRVARVYGSPNPARKALNAMLKQLFDVKMEHARSKGEKEVARYTFTDARVRSTIKTLGMSVCEVEEFGEEYELAYRGRRAEGQGHEPLPDIDLFKAQLEKDNDVRICVYNFSHDDGYQERVLVAFQVKSNHSHLAFYGRTSRSAILAIQKALRNATL